MNPSVTDTRHKITLDTMLIFNVDTDIWTQFKMQQKCDIKRTNDLINRPRSDLTSCTVTCGSKLQSMMQML